METERHPLGQRDRRDRRARDVFGVENVEFAGVGRRVVDDGQDPPRVLGRAVGLPDERYGERVAAFVQLGEGASLDLDEVRPHFAEIGVAKQKTPEHLEFVTEFPRTPSGKVRKVDLRDRLTNG